MTAGGGEHRGPAFAPGIWQVAPGLPARDLISLIELYDAIGVAGVVATQMHAAPWAPLAVAAVASDSMALATGVAIATSRAPFETAMSAIELDVLSGGRLTLGLGSGTRAWCRDLYGVEVTRPVAHLEEVVAAVRAIIRGLHDGSTVVWDGNHVHVDLRRSAPNVRPIRSSIPVAIGGLREPMVRLAGRVGDGLIGHPLWTTEWVDEVVDPALQQSLAAAGRAATACPQMHWVFTALGDDEGVAVDDARATVAFYAAMPSYGSFFAWHGYEREAAEAVRLAEDGPRAAVEAVSEEMARRFVLVGPADAAVPTLAARARRTSICIVPPVAIDRRRQTTYAAEALGAVRALVALDLETEGGRP